MVRDLTITANACNLNRITLAAGLYIISPWHWIYDMMRSFADGAVTLVTLCSSVCVCHSIWPVWRHHGRRQISCRLMWASRRIQQVKDLIPVFYFHWLPPSFVPSFRLFFPPWFLPHLTPIPHLICSWVDCVFTEAWLIFPAELCRNTVMFFSQCWLHLSGTFDMLVVGSR